MSKIKYLLIFIAVLSVSLAFAQSTSVGFKDATTATRTLVWQENASYPSPTLAGYAKWVVQLYKSTDDIISPLNADGSPGGDDILSTTVSNATMGLTFGPTGGLNQGSVVFAALNGAGNTWQGDKVYLRIFNSSSIATATKYFQFTNLYTVPIATTVNVNILPSYGWSTWITKPVTPLVSGAITSLLPLNGVTVNCTGQAPVVTTTTGLFNFSVAPGADITITPTKPNFKFTPAFLTYDNVTEPITGVDFVMTSAAPNTTNTPTPSNTALNIQPTIGQVSWQFAPVAGYELPTGFKVYFPETTLLATVPYTGAGTYSAAIPLLSYNTTYNWKIVPTNANKQGGYDALEVKGANNSKSDATSVITWAFTTRNSNTILPGVAETIDPDGAGSLAPFVFNTPGSAPVISYQIVPLASIPNYPVMGTVTTGFGVIMTTSASTDVADLSVTIPAGYWFAVAYYGGAWHQSNPYPTMGGVVNFPGMTFDGPVYLVFSRDVPLPVELSSFTAVYTAGFFVQLTWVVQSETNHLGYYVLRSQNQDLQTAANLNPTEPISGGSNSGSQITYNYRDQEVDTNTTYYYWLESVDLDNTSKFFGPISVVVNNDQPDPTPTIPLVTELLNAYPNPFASNTAFRYTLKEAANVRLAVYNIKGQVVWSSSSLNQAKGLNKIIWNGTDSSGKPVSSGIYYYRMTSGKYTASKKIVLVK